MIVGSLDQEDAACLALVLIEEEHNVVFFTSRYYISRGSKGMESVYLSAISTNAL